MPGRGSIVQQVALPPLRYLLLQRAVLGAAQVLLHRAIFALRLWLLRLQPLLLGLSLVGGREGAVVQVLPRELSADEWLSFSTIACVRVQSRCRQSKRLCVLSAHSTRPVQGHALL